MMALRFYLRDVIDKCSMGWLKDVDGVTNHKTLVDQILERPSERTLFVTFNYDELIEDALLGLSREGPTRSILLTSTRLIRIILVYNNTLQ